MKLKTIFLGVGLFTVCCIISVYLLKRKASIEFSDFPRKITDTINFDSYTWNNLPILHVNANGPIGYYIYAGKDNDHESSFNFFPAENNYEILNVLKLGNKIHYVYKDRQIWSIKKPNNEVVKEIKLPLYTQNACLTNDSKLFVKYFDYGGSRQSILALMDSTNKVIKKWKHVFPINNDGGLSTESKIVYKDSIVYCISQYSNNVQIIDIRNDAVSLKHTIEKQSAYPKTISSQNDKVFSFQENPFFIHPMSKIIGNYIYIISTYKTDPSQKGNHRSLFMDIYNTKMEYISTCYLKNIRTEAITDFIFLNKQFVFTNGNKFIEGILK